MRLWVLTQLTTVFPTRLFYFFIFQTLISSFFDMEIKYCLFSMKRSCQERHIMPYFNHGLWENKKIQSLTFYTVLDIGICLSKYIIYKNLFFKMLQFTVLCYLYIDSRFRKTPFPTIHLHIYDKTCCCVLCVYVMCAHLVCFMCVLVLCAR